MTANKK